MAYRGPGYEKFKVDHGTVKISFEPGSIGDGSSVNDGQQPVVFSLRVRTSFPSGQGPGSKKIRSLGLINGGV
jgi:hypothetical protein